MIKDRIIWICYFFYFFILLKVWTQTTSLPSTVIGYFRQSPSSSLTDWKQIVWKYPFHQSLPWCSSVRLSWRFAWWPIFHFQMLTGIPPLDHRVSSPQTSLPAVVEYHSHQSVCFNQFYLELQLHCLQSCGRFDRPLAVLLRDFHHWRGGLGGGPQQPVDGQFLQQFVIVISRVPNPLSFQRVHHVRIWSSDE